VLGVLTAALLVVAAAGCGGDESAQTTAPGTTAPATTAPETTASPTTTATTTTAPATTAPPPPATKPEPDVTLVKITIRGGKVVGGLERVTVEKDRDVTLLVTADVSDEVHLHGYDKSADVTPQKPARLVFKATLRGRFEVELEERGLQIAELTVK
jgi:hypothetical protein